MKMFTRRHYTAVAQTLARRYMVEKSLGASEKELGAIRLLASDFSILFGTDNLRFDAPKFHRACNLR